MDDTLTAHPAPPADAEPRRVALVLLAFPHDPARVGEIAFFPAAGQRPAVLGRHGDLAFARHRPERWTPTGGADDPHLSRRQLELAPGGEVENVGRLPLLLNGHPASRASVREGDLLQVGEQMLLLVVRRARTLPGEVEEGHPFGGPDRVGLVGESPAAWRLREQVRFAARRDQHVLVLGESGTGKELAARGLHAYSRRARRPLVSRSAATIPESLADAELFGNIAGYPNPGMPARPGLVGEADGGLLFLDEFGELPVEQQARLLRVLDQGEYTRLGDAKPQRADLRLIAATNHDPRTLEHDLVARFPLQLRVPPLAERIEDVPLLALHFLRGLCAQDAELAGRFCGADGWPRASMGLWRALVTHGYTAHVRELRAMLWRSISASDGPALAAPPTAPHPVEADPVSLDPAVVQAVLDRHGGRQEPAWRELGLASRHVLTRLVKKHGLVVRGRG